MAGRKLTPQEAELRKKCIEARRDGLTYRQIAEKFSISESAAYRYVQKYIAECIEEPTKELIQIEKDRLDHLLAALKDGIDKGNPRAIEVAVKVLDRKHKLQGLDAPQRIEAQVETVMSPEERELAELLKEAKTLNDRSA